MSNCLKLYCDCLKAGQFCTTLCNCCECKNNEHNEEVKTLIKKLKKDDIPPSQAGSSKLGICKCKKSQCKKYYCECLQAGRPCSSRCLCDDCANHKRHVDDENHSHKDHSLICHEHDSQKQDGGDFVMLDESADKPDRQIKPL